MDTSEPISAYTLHKEWAIFNNSIFIQLSYIDYENIITKESFKIWVN